MAHESQERYSKMVLAKMRAETVLKDGVVFNNDYEGNPKAGAVKIPVRDEEVAVSDYDKVKGIEAGTGSTSYQTLVINKDKAVSEIIDGYDAESVPDNLVADRLDSAGYSLASVLDNDGGSVLLAEGEKFNASSVDSTSAYDLIVEVRKEMSKANVPNDKNRYLLATPEFYAMLLKDKDHFVDSSVLGDNIKQSGAVGKIAGFNVYEWNDSTANLMFIAGHPKFATRVNEWSVPVKLEDLKDGKHIGASWVNGRTVYAHKVLRPSAIRPVFVPGSLMLSQSSYSSGKCKITVTQEASSSFVYRVNPAVRAKYAENFSSAQAFVSGTTDIACSKGDVIEIIDLNSRLLSK